MSKKSLDRKLARQFIVDQRGNNISDQEIYNELSQQYHDKKTIALLITGTSTLGNKIKYKVYNNILLGLIGVTILIKILFVISLSLDSQEPWALVAIFIVPLLNIYFFYEIARYNAPIYRLLGALTIVGFFQTVVHVETKIEILVYLILFGAIAGLAFYLDNKLFPNFSPNNLKKDTSGEYILN